MALIKCPECGKEVSSAATSCPNCGHPISGKKEKIVVEKTKKKGNCFSKVLFFVLFFIFLGVGLGMLSDDENKTSSDQNNTTTNQEETCLITNLKNIGFTMLFAKKPVFMRLFDIENYQNWLLFLPLLIVFFDAV